MKKHARHLGYLTAAVLMAVTMYALMRNMTLAEISDIAKRVDVKFVVMGLLSLLVYVGIEMWIMDDLIKEICKVKGLWISFKATVVGQYYSLITPFASGGQPAQMYVMRKDNIPLSKSSAVLANKFIFFQVGVTVYSLVLFLFNFGRISEVLQKATLFVVCGLSINTVGLFCVIMLLYNPHKLKRIVYVFLRFIHNIHIIRRHRRKYKIFSRYVDEYKADIDAIAKNKFLIAKSFLLTGVQLTAYFGITYFVYRALSLQGSSFFEIVSLQSFLYMAVSFIPTPGTLGAGEIGFYSIFGIVFGRGVLRYAILLWRLISFYATLLISAAITFGIYIAEKLEPYIIK